MADDQKWRSRGPLSFIDKAKLKDAREAERAEVEYAQRLISQGGPLMPTAEEIEQARAAYVKAFPNASPDDGNPAIEGRAQIYAMCRQYPEVGALLGKMNMDAPFGFGVIDVGLTHGRHFHCVLQPEDFLTYALAGDIVLNDQNQPDYIGKLRLRG